MDKDNVSKFLRDAQIFFLRGRLPAADVYRAKEELDLLLALKLLRCPFLEKKLKGITEIKEISERVDFAQSPYEQDKGTKYLTPDLLTQWILDNQVVQLLLGDSIHMEIIKRCHEVLKFLIKYNKFPLSIIDTIFTAVANKHGKKK